MILNPGQCNCICLEENVVNAKLHYGRIEMETTDHNDLLGVTIDREKIYAI